MTTATTIDHAATPGNELADGVITSGCDFYPPASSKFSEVDRSSNTLKLMVAASKAAGFALSGDLRVGERDAAALLGYHPHYLKTLRQTGRGPVSYLRGLGGCRISYRLFDLVAWIESARDDR